VPDADALDSPTNYEGATAMASRAKKTTMGKLNRERKLREKRFDKQAKKEARKLAADQPDQPTDGLAGDSSEPIGPPSEQPEPADLVA
jgi:hypothetical protein